MPIAKHIRPERVRSDLGGGVCAEPCPRAFDPIRIRFDHQVFSLQDAGGASRYHFELLRNLAEVPGVCADLFLGMSGCRLPFEDLPPERALVTRYRGSLRPGAARYILNEFLGNLRSAASCVDIYHPTLYRRMPLVRARRLVVTHHDCIHERFPDLFPNARLIIRAKRRLFSDADAIICVSESSRRDLLQFYVVDAAKTRVIHHGLHRLTGSAAAAVELRAKAPEEYLLFVGSRAPYKNFNNFLRAFRATGLHKSMLLLAAGGGPWTPEERALAEKLAVTGRMVLFPQLTDTLLAEAYAAATLFVYPSRCEGFGFPPLEAMAAECPVLVSNTSSLPEVCHDAPFYFDPQDQSSFERKLLEATTDEPARRQARERGVRVAAQYNWGTCARQTLALYRECR
jgi:glycosyltransferase involved in cell wall biosynthesis